MPVHNYLDISTAHLRQEDALKLNHVDTDYIWNRPYGAIFFVPHCDEDFDVYKDLGFSEDFFDLLRYAAEKSCFWIMVDSDGRKHDDLPVFNW